MERSLEKLLIIIIPTFVDLQGFIVGSWFVVKEVMLKKGSVLSHYIFANPYPWDLFTKSEKSCASWLIANHELQWEAGMIPYSMARHLITSHTTTHVASPTKSRRAVKKITEKFVSMYTLI